MCFGPLVPLYQFLYVALEVWAYPEPVERTPSYAFAVYLMGASLGTPLPPPGAFLSLLFAFVLPQLSPAVRL